MLTQCGPGLRPRPVIGFSSAAVAVGIVGPGQVAHTLGFSGQVFNAGCKAVVHVSKQIVALVPALVSYVDSQTACHGSVPNVTSAFLHLSQFSVSTSFKVALLVSHHEIAQKLIEPVVQYGVSCTWVYEGAHLVVFKVRESLVVNKHIVAQHANAHHGQCVAQSPVAPVVAR